MSLLISALYTAAALLGAAFAIVELRMLWRFMRNRTAIRDLVRSKATSTQPHSAGELPTVTIQLPLYNERTAAEQIVRAAAGQDYPRNRFDVQILDDSDDETADIVARVAAELAADGVRIEHVRREKRSGYKAGALAAGLERSDSEFVAVFDADFVPEPSFLRSIIVDEQAFSEPTVAFAQARWAWRQPVRGMLASALALLLDRHFFIQKPTRAFFGNVTTFNGSAGVWRRAAVEEAGGWSAATLTEDLDLSYRCALLGWHGKYLRDVPVVNELPGHMRALKVQQHRWAKGSTQCFKKLVGTIFASGSILRDRVDEAFLLAGYAIHPVLLVNLMLWPWAVLYMDRTYFWVIQALMGLVVAVVPVGFALTVVERDGQWRSAAVRQILAGLFVGVGLMVNNTVGQLQGILAPGGEFVRTPKANTEGQAGGTGRDVPEAYTVPLHWTFFLEIAFIGYCLAGTAALVSGGEAFWAAPMVFWAGCLAIVVHLQVAPTPT